MGDLVKNRRAYYDYEILESYETGIVLQGTEVKSLREGGGHLEEAYVRVIQSELWLVGASISPYRYGSLSNHVEQRDRKLLMHRREIDRLKRETREKGMTLVPLAIFLKGGNIKVKIGLARGKRKVDKRQAIKEKEEKRRIDRRLKQA